MRSEVLRAAVRFLVCPSLSGGQIGEAGDRRMLISGLTDRGDALDNVGRKVVGKVGDAEPNRGKRRGDDEGKPSPMVDSVRSCDVGRTMAGSGLVLIEMGRR